MKKIVTSILLGVGALSINAGIVNLASAEEVSSDVVVDSEVDYDYLVTDGDNLTILAEGEIGEIIVEAGGTLVVDSLVNIESLYVYAGASVTLNSCMVSNFIIEYGEGYNAEDITIGNKTEVFATYLTMLIPAGSESATISLPDISNVYYDVDCYFGAWTEPDSEGYNKCLGSFSGQTFTSATNYNYISSNQDVELLAGGCDTTYNAIAFVTSVNNSDYGTVSESVMYSTIDGYFNKKVKMEFSPNEGYEVSSIKVNGESAEASSHYTFTTSETTGINTFHIDFAEAIKTEYQVTTSANEGGNITTSFTAEEGSKIDVLVTALEGYEIASIMVNGNPLAISAGLSTYTHSVDAISENITVVATFKLKQYTISMHAGIGGSVSGSGTVNHGEDAIITITASEGYVIKSLTVDGVNKTVSGNAYTIENVTSSHSIQVEFEKIKFSISFVASANGSISTSSSVEYGSSADVVITPNSGYIVTAVKVNGASVNFDVIDGKPSFTIQNIKSNKQIEAIYSLAEFNVSVKTDLGVTACYDEVVSYSSTTEISICVTKGYYVTSITKNGTELSPSEVASIVDAGKISLTNVCSNVNIIISADKTVYSITYNLNGGVNSKDNLQTFTISDVGSTLSSPTKVGYKFKGWKIGDKIVSSLTITNDLLKDLSVSAEWEEVDLSSTGLTPGEVVGILSGGVALSGGLAVSAILALKKKKWFD